MNSNNRLWRWLGLIFVLSFGALGYLGWQIYLEAPPIPKAVVTTGGEVLFTGEQVSRGQQVWLASGGQQQGSVWGHGAYVAPDWSADWLHREAHALQAIRTQELRKAPRGADGGRPRRDRRGAQGRDAPQHLRRGHRDRHGLAGTGAGHPRRGEPLRRICSATTPRSTSCATSTR